MSFHVLMMSVSAIKVWSPPPILYGERKHFPLPSWRRSNLRKSSGNSTPMVASALLIAFSDAPGGSEDESPTRDSRKAQHSSTDSMQPSKDQAFAAMLF